VHIPFPDTRTLAANLTSSSLSGLLLPQDDTQSLRAVCSPRLVILGYKDWTPFLNLGPSEGPCGPKSPKELTEASCAHWGDHLLPLPNPVLSLTIVCLPKALPDNSPSQGCFQKLTLKTVCASSHPGRQTLKWGFGEGPLAHSYQ
jgi:hypothetical protein